MKDLLVELIGKISSGCMTDEEVLRIASEAAEAYADPQAFLAANPAVAREIEDKIRSASGLDFIRNVLGGTRVATTSVTRCTEVVHHDEAAVCAQHEGVFATNSTSGTSNDADPTFNHFMIRHVLTLGVQAWVERSRISEKSAP